ncbi:MAG TPA: MazG nucleotide pyrophosphohydrolase domain-containing protein [Corynebacterium sp.]|nr:MazG nucleotide pyrophosphohydrolase domain-containing protein [Corynebacterium sp.]
MTVLILDPRWPTLIPMEAHGLLESPVTYTAEVPVTVRWNFEHLITGADITGRGVLVTTDAQDPTTQARINRGEYVIEAASRHDPVFEAQQVMARAVRQGEWEAGQSHESLLPYLKEETEEFSTAVRAGAGEEELLAELGDVLLQVLFHAEIASRRGAFDFSQVAGAFVAKMRSRAPYLFDGTVGLVPEQEQERLWEQGKRRELAQGPESGPIEAREI